MEKLESVQYSAALAVTGTWRGTSREKLYAELGWESLSSRRWSRHLTLFYKIVNDLTPLYTRDPIPALHQSQYSLRKQDVVGRIGARTEKFQSSFYPNCICEWNKLDPEIRLAPSVAVFKVHVNPNFHKTFLAVAVKFCLYLSIFHCFQLIFLARTKRNSPSKAPTQCEQRNRYFDFCGVILMTTATEGAT